MKVKVKGVKFMFPILTTQIEIANVREVESGRGNKYVAVAFFDDNGYANTYWFPIEFKEFAEQNLRKTVTATFSYFGGSRDGSRRPSLRGVSLG